MFGKFNAKIKDYGLALSKEKHLQVNVQFEFPLTEGGMQELTWYGSFTGGAKDITLKTLITLGLTPNNFSRLTKDFNKGPSSLLLNTSKEYVINVVEEPRQDDPTKTITKINYIIDPEFSGAKKLTEQEQAQYVGTLSFEAELVRLFADAPQSKVPQVHGQQTQQQQQYQQQMPMSNQGQTQQYQQPQPQYQQPQYQQPQQQHQQNGFKPPF